MKPPILFLIFNRPDLTNKVFTEIKKQKPTQLFIAADGPRKDNPGEEEICKQTRQLVLNAIDWECDVKTRFQHENLGCGKAVSSAIDWFFENVDEGIILEDDCLPDQTFFTFCTELLQYYRNDDKVMHISGNNFQLGQIRGEGSYYFSRYAYIWGWATWKRAWMKYDFNLQRYRKCSTEGLSKSLIRYLHSIHNKEIDTWDFQWFFAVWFNKGKAINPQVNLVKNIGYGVSGSHTRRVSWWLKKMTYGKLVTIVHPYNKEINIIADKYVSDKIFTNSFILNFSKKIYRGIFYKRRKYSST